MAKMRKKQNDMDAKARQRAASKAAGLEFKFHTGYGDTQRNIFFGPRSKTTGYSGYTEDVLAQSVRKGKLVKVTAPNSMTIPQVESQMKKQALANIPKSKRAQASFLASEKKKSGKTTAKNVKRRER